MTLYDICWYFILYSFIGWVIEVIYHAVTLGKMMNRGFLNGPVCPVYGFGMAAVLSVYNGIGSDNSLIIFIEGILLTTAIELLAGFVLDKAFHARWWDYSKVPLNLNGYICLKFSIIWGFAVVFVLKIFNPVLYSLTIALIPVKIGIILLTVLIIVFIVDTVVTALTLIGLNRKLQELDEISKTLHSLSDVLTEHISENSIKTAQTVQSAQVQLSLARIEIKDDMEEAEDQLRRKLQERANDIRRTITGNIHFGSGRIINVFPNARHRDYSHILEEIRERINS